MLLTGEPPVLDVVQVGFLPQAWDPLRLISPPDTPPLIIMQHRERRASETPLAHLQGQIVRTDRRHDRRALSVEELRRLLAAAQKGPERFGLGWAERAIVYRLAAESGLRAMNCGA